MRFLALQILRGSVQRGAGSGGQEIMSLPGRTAGSPWLRSSQVAGRPEEGPKDVGGKAGGPRLPPGPSSRVAQGAGRGTRPLRRVPSAPGSGSLPFTQNVRTIASNVRVGDLRGQRGGRSRSRARLASFGWGGRHPASRRGAREGTAGGKRSREPPRMCGSGTARADSASSCECGPGRRGRTQGHDRRWGEETGGSRGRNARRPSVASIVASGCAVPQLRFRGLD